MRAAHLLILPALAATGCENDQSINRIRTPPIAQITWPAPSSTLRQGEGPQPFNGTVYDEYDPAPSLDVRWIIDDDEEAAISAEADEDGFLVLDLDVDSMDVGEHLTELMVVDSDGEMDIFGMTWFLKGPISAPDVEILDPEDGAFFEPGEEITFRGEATDEGTEDLSSLVFVWTSSLVADPLEGAISADGQSVLFTDSLPEGSHTITLTATDLDGEVGEDSIQINIGEVVEPAQPGDLVFSEMMINPEIVQDEVGEWVELYNTASYAIDVAGYTFRDDDYDEYELEGPLLVAGNDFIVLCADTSPSRNGGVPCDGAFKRASADALALGNNSDEVILARPDGVIIDAVYYDREWFTKGVAIGLDPDEVDADTNDSPDSWCDQTTVMTSGGEPGTPGRRNDNCF